MPKKITVVIPSAGRAALLQHVLDGLRTQTFNDFEVLLVLKPGDVETINVVEQFNKYLDIQVHFQKHPGFMRAVNEGIDAATGDLILFLDDDAVPKPNCIAEHISTYEHNDVSGVSGNVIPTSLVDGVLKPYENCSDIVSIYEEPKFLRKIGRIFWNKPLEGQENFLAYISKAGYSKKNIDLFHQEKSDSLLCMGANTSVLTSALSNYRIPTSFLKRGIANEQVVGWNLWKKGHSMVFNSKAVVYHIQHGETLSRFLDISNIFQATIENELLFYYLLPMEKKVSVMHRVVSLMYNSLVHLKKIKKNGKYELSILRAILVGNLIGIKWIISRKIGGSYIPSYDSFYQ
ncbi:MAG: glycosyltransferase family 2 protein [Tenericutes bacterium]|nr:glycosyltransferase family 2 protein [Mycoplasmatota bacterium]